MQKSRKRIVSAIVSASLVLGLWSGYAIPARAEENGSGQTPPTEIGEPTPTPTVTPSASPSVEPSTEPSAEPTVTPEPVDVTKIAISRKSAVLMVGKTLKPVITGTTSTVTWTSANEKIAKVDETGKIKALKKGKTVITAALTAEVLGNQVTRLYDVGVAGLHRLISHVDEIMSASVIIAIAGMEGALASVIGGMADCPVIAVPTSVGYGANFGGLSALLSMLNSCASGVSVVNIDNGFGAAYQASMINHMRAK